MCRGGGGEGPEEKREGKEDREQSKRRIEK
jgi:hypothetical protein